MRFKGKVALVLPVPLLYQYPFERYNETDFPAVLLSWQYLSIVVENSGQLG